MRFRKLVSVFLAAVLCLAVCGASSASEATGTLFQTPAGADSVRALLEKTKEFAQSGGDYSVIADIHDRQACAAYYLIMILAGRNFASETVTEITWEEAMEKTALLAGDAASLTEKDPELAEALKKAMRVIDRDRVLNDIMGGLRESFRNGEVSADDPDYETLSGMLTDWDKGTDYVFAHYEDYLRGIIGADYPFSLDEVLEMIRNRVFLDYAPEIARYRDYDFEYRPENTDIGVNGTIFRYDIGIVKTGDYEGIGMKMLYYYRDGAYYLIDYSFVYY